jgi:type III restriction enzyme
LRIFIKEKTGIKFKVKTFKHGDNLEKITKNEYYSGFIINEINYSRKFVSFSNGIRVYIGQASVNKEEILKIMVKETIESHLEKKSELNPIGIKVLSLFFINRVDDYLPQDSVLRRVFEETYIELVTNEFPEFSSIDPKTIHSGYFSRMRQVSSIERDEEAFNLIMRDKERLLSLDEPVEFIFSHSALREGWDNPNVFNICTLSYSQSEIKKRQEIGRGLRLPVNVQGERIQDREINKLTVVTNESYHEYVSKLQTEFREDAGVESPPIENKRERTTLRLKEPMLQTSDFIDLWRRLSPKVNYDVNIDSNELVNKCVKEINELDVKPLKLDVIKYLIDEITPEETFGEVSSEGYEEIKLDKTFNIVHYVEQETKLTRKTVYEIIKGVNNFDQFFKNPQSYADNVVTVIKNNLTNLILDNIQYQEISEEYQIEEFKKKIETYDKYIVELHNDKTPYTLEKKPIDAVNIDPGPGETGISTPELEFAKALDRDSRVKLFIKLPDWYKIPTPIGNYNPDWAIIIEKQNKEGEKEKLYYIIETKSTNIIGNLREHEQYKIKSARRRFKVTTYVKFEAPVKDFRSFERIFSDY